MDEASLLRPPIAFVILAAGPGTRFGGEAPKLLLDLDGKPLLQHVVDTAAASGAEEVLVVIGHEENAVRAAVSLAEPASFVLNLDHADGVAVSLTAGLLAASPEVEAAVILHGDRPGIHAETVATLIEVYRDTRMPIVRARYRDAPGPALIAAALWEEAIQHAAGADDDGTAFIEANADLVETLEVDANAPIDVDTPLDYERLGSPQRA